MSALTIDDVRRLAQGLPETREADHHGMASLRVGDRIFATIPDEQHVRIMAEEGEILAATERDPATYEAFWWGKRLACVVIDLRRVEPDELSELLVGAYLRKAPARIVRSWRDGT